jgi:hypothetical protein
MRSKMSDAYSGNRVIRYSVGVDNSEYKKGVTITRNAFFATAKFLVGRAGFEPATNG